MFTREELRKASIRETKEYHDIYENFRLGAEWLKKKLLSGNLIAMPGCTRVEVIEETGRKYVNWKEGNIVNISIQDGGRTIKIFISDSETKE